MIELNQSDFSPLDSPGYFQYEIQTIYHQMPASERELLHHLRPEKARELWEYASEYSTELSRYLFSDTLEPITSSSLYEWIGHLDLKNMNWSGRHEVGQRSLQALHSHNDQVIIVFWTVEEALAVPWHIFYAYWDDFCRISLEDVLAFPLSEEWYLVFYHEDQMVIGRPRLPLLDEVARKTLSERTKPLIHQAEVLRLLLANEKLSAIKLYQQETGVGYKQAMEAVNKLLKDFQSMA